MEVVHGCVLFEQGKFIAESPLRSWHRMYSQWSDNVSVSMIFVSGRDSPLIPLHSRCASPHVRLTTPRPWSPSASWSATSERHCWQKWQPASPPLRSPCTYNCDGSKYCIRYDAPRILTVVVHLQALGCSRWNH